MRICFEEAVTGEGEEGSGSGSEAFYPAHDTRMHALRRREPADPFPFSLLRRPSSYLLLGLRHPRRSQLQSEDSSSRWIVVEAPFLFAPLLLLAGQSVTVYVERGVRVSVSGLA